MLTNPRILAFINHQNANDFDPYYVYDSQLIRNHCRLFRDISYPNKSIHFASMANVNPRFLRIVKDEGVNIFVNSTMHLRVALEAGFKQEEIIFTSSALDEKTMALVHSAGAQINVDSPMQLEKWKKLFPSKKAGIRCNIGDKVKPYSTHAGYFIGRQSRLGFTSEEIADIKDKPGVAGLHLYAGTDIFDVDYFISCYERLADLSTDFPALQYLNFGGGFGVSENGHEQFNFAEFNKRVSRLMYQVSENQNRQLKLVLEPGRIIGGLAGYFVCKVTDVKQRPGKNLVGVNASTVQFSRPLLYPEAANHPVMIIRNGEVVNSSAGQETIVYGCSTYSRDIFSDKQKLPAMEPGDVVVFGNAGSYSASSHMQFLGFPKPEEYFL